MSDTTTDPQAEPAEPVAPAEQVEPVAQAEPEAPAEPAEQVAQVEQPDAVRHARAPYARSPEGERVRRGVLCMPETHGVKYDKGAEPWRGTMARSGEAPTCPDCLALMGDAGHKPAGPEKAEGKPAGPSGQGKGEQASEAILATPEMVSAMVGPLVTAGLYLLTQGEARLVNADPELVKSITGLRSMAVEPAPTSPAYPAWVAWVAYLREALKRAGGELPAWVCCVIATVPLVGAVAMCAGSGKPAKGKGK